MRSDSFSDAGFVKSCKKTSEQQFLEEMQTDIPWKELTEAIEPIYLKSEGSGLTPIGIESMLRIYFLQHWLNFSDPAVKGAIFDSSMLRQFVGIDLGREPVPDVTTICKIRDLMERHILGDQLFQLVNKYLKESGLKVSRITFVDASIINAPSPTKNKKKERDPDMRQTRKGNQWHFGMKAHISFASRANLNHPVLAASVNVHDSEVLSDLLHGEEAPDCCGELRRICSEALPEKQSWGVSLSSESSMLSFWSGNF
jgi:transposase, IS5 family